MYSTLYSMYRAVRAYSHQMTKPSSDSKRIEVGATELRQNLAKYLTCAGYYGGRVLVTRPGVPKPVAVIISYDEFARLTTRKSAA